MERCIVPQATGKTRKSCVGLIFYIYLKLTDLKYYGLKSLKYSSGKIWNTVPFEIRNAVSLGKFSTKIQGLETWEMPFVGCVWPVYAKQVTCNV